MGISKYKIIHWKWKSYGKERENISPMITEVEFDIKAYRFLS